MKFSDSWGMMTGKIPKTQEYHELTAANQAHQVASTIGSGPGDIHYDAAYNRAHANSLARDTGQGGSSRAGSGRRDRSTFRNPGPSEGIFGYEGFLRPKTGNAFQDLNRFTPLGLLSGLINAATTKPVDSGASYTFNTQSGVGPGTSPQQNLAGFTAPKVNTSLLKNPVTPEQSAPMMPGYIDPNFDTTSGFSNTADISQNDDNMFGTNPLNFGSGEMDDLPLIPQSFLGGAIDAPADFFASADGGVSVEDAAFQEWLGTEGNSKAIQQWEATNPGFARRMFDRSQFLKRGGGVNSEGNL